MASSSASGYGVYSPAAIDPFPIEQVLAKIVGDNNPGNAANLLGQYQVERQTSQGNYNYEMNRQHEFARDQLAATMHENNLKALQEGSKNPGLLDLMNSPQYADVVAGIDPAVLQRVSTNLRNMQAAEQFQKGAGGLASATSAGFQPSTGQASAITGGYAGPQGTPEAEKVAQINAASRLAAAAQSAGGGNAYSIPLPAQPSLGYVAPSLTVRKNQTLQGAIEQAKRDGLQINTPVNPPPTGGSGSPATSAAPATGGRSATNLQAKPGTPTPNTAQGGGDVHRRAETFVENEIRPRNQAMYDDIVAGKVGGRVNVITAPDGTIHIKGKERTY